jgi:hypothetical protein
MKKAPLLCLLSPSSPWRVRNWAGGKSRNIRASSAKIAELSHLLNNLKEYTHLISRYRMAVSADGFNWRSEK